MTCPLAEIKEVSIAQGRTEMCRRTRVDNTITTKRKIRILNNWNITTRTAYSIVVPLWPSTYWPLMNRPVLKEVFPLYTSVSHSRENISGMVQTIGCRNRNLGI